MSNDFSMLTPKQQKRVHWWIQKQNIERAIWKEKHSKKLEPKTLHVSVRHMNYSQFKDMIHSNVIDIMYTRNAPHRSWLRQIADDFLEGNKRQQKAVAQTFANECQPEAQKLLKHPKKVLKKVLNDPMVLYYLYMHSDN